MSRHTVRDDDQFTVVVGWDPPTQTYFVQVHNVKVKRDDPDSREAIPVWAGFKPGEISTPEEAAEKVQKWVQIPDDVLVALREDKEGNRG